MATFEFTRSDSNNGTQKLRFTWNETISGTTATVHITKVELWSSAWGGFDCACKWALEVDGSTILTVNQDSSSVRMGLNTYKEITIPALPVTKAVTSFNADGTRTPVVKLKKLSGQSNPLVHMFGGYLSPDEYVLDRNFEWTDNDSTTITLTKVSVANLSVTATNSTVEVKRGGSTISSGTALYYGDVLTITATPASGYRLTAVKVNGDAITNGGTYTVTGACAVTTTVEAYTASTMSIAGATIGSQMTFTINRANSSFTHTLQYRFHSDSGSWTTIGTAKFTGTTVTFTPALSTFGAKIPSSKTGKWDFCLYTYSGNTQVGSVQTTSEYTLTMPSSAAPTIASGMAHLGFDNTGTAAHDINASAKGYSKVTLVVDDVTKITTNYSATLASIKATYGGVTATLTDNGEAAMGVATTTSVSVVVTVTDTRGYTATTTLTESINDYFRPKITNVTIKRLKYVAPNYTEDDTGSYIGVKATGTIASLAGQNAIYGSNISVYIKPVGGSYGSPTPVSPAGTETRWNAGLDPTKSYVVRFEMLDTVGRQSSPSVVSSLEVTIPTASVAFNIRDGGNGAAFGKYAEADGVLDIGSWSAVGRVLGLGQARASIPSNAHFSGYVEPGVYGVSTNEIAGTIDDSPSGTAGVLRVWISNGRNKNPGDGSYYIIQEYTNTYGNAWRRRGYAVDEDDPVTFVDWVGYGTKSAIGLGSLTYDAPTSISNGSSASITLASSSRGMIAVCGVDDSGRDIILYAVNSSGVVYYTAVRGASGLSLSKSTNTLTITNSSGYAVYPMQFIR